MKKGLFAVALILGMTCAAQAETKMPPLKAGIGFSLIDNKINHLETLTLAEKWGVALEAGYAGDADSVGHKLVAVLSYDLLKLKKYIDLPVLDLIELRPGVYAGFGSINSQRIFESELDWGLSATILTLKF